MKKLIILTSISLIFLSSCEVEFRGEQRYTHYRGYEHRHYPDHHDEYNHGYHHNERGGENKPEHPR
ncbi:MAG: hypothetical protein ACHQRM_17195 [Bacteroidia bacterium]